MWPGQQPPGGEQNPQDQSQNPYQQSGYQQPNPYQQQPPTQPGYPQQPPTQPGYPQQPPAQPGYPQQGYAQQPGYPNPYQQPTVPQQYAVPGPGQPGGPDGGKKKQTTIVAIVAATAVVVAAGVAAFLVLGKDDDKKNTADDPKPSVTATASADPSSAPAPDPSQSSGIDNPRDGAAQQPTIPGWKVVYNPKYGTLFDVPPEWEVFKPGSITFFEDEKKGGGLPLVTMSSPTSFKSKWCTYDVNKNGTDETWSLSTAGTKGGQGAKDTSSLARSEAGTWVWGGYAQHMPQSTIKITKPVPYTTKSGLTGSMATATAPNVKKRNKCETDGKSIAFSFKNAAGDFSTWVLYGADGVKDELPDATIRQILSTVRLAPSGS
ncbi:hypothetical protein [Streptomyces vietnamensis]|uniref:Membrane protein n=1 Tax=Streptomyces vietnamensis TaxID=362257 RepID=A0A0B5HPG3_9ACTN|nr:hypothetical protein [Streptomyces vietnamensis]AJF64005.1 membrane protein [Streptomyces vietnamensis]